MLSKNRLWMSLMLSIMSGAVTITSARAFPDSPPPQDVFSPDTLVNFSSSTVGGTIGGSDSLGLTGSIAIPSEMSVSTGAGDGSGSNGEGSNGTRTITVADIADYYATNIDRSLNDLATEDVAQKPRRIVRRRNTACPNPQISSSSEKLDELLNQSEQFIEQVNQIKPEKRIW